MASAPASSKQSTEPEPVKPKKKICCACPDTKVLLLTDGLQGGCSCSGDCRCRRRCWLRYDSWAAHPGACHCPACLLPAAAAEGQGRVHHHPRPRRASVPAADRGAQAVPARRGLQRGCCHAAGAASRCAPSSGSIGQRPPSLCYPGLPTCLPACRSRPPLQQPQQRQGRGQAPACSQGRPAWLEARLEAGLEAAQQDEQAAEGAAEPVCGHHRRRHQPGHTLPGGVGVGGGGGDRDLLHQWHAHAGGAGGRVAAGQVGGQARRAGG